MRFLVVDDEAPIHRVLRRVLTLEGHQVEIARDGREALSILTAGARFDAVLVDWNMPQMHGGEVVAAMADIPGMTDTRVFIVSGSPNAKRDLGGIDGWLDKPFTAGSVLAALAASGLPVEHAHLA